jgi:hypothetical protein
MCNSFHGGFQPFDLTAGLHRAYSSNLCSSGQQKLTTTNNRPSVQVAAENIGALAAVL